jgi:photosystem II stability/assembly factor-like uncharacterized protein
MIDSSAFRSTVLLHITIACWLQVSVVVSQERMTSETIFAPTTGAEKIASWRLHQKLKQDAPFRANWQLTGPVMCGGRIEAIACSPSKNPTVYVGAGSGGLWKTSGNWTSWKSIFDDQPTQAIGDVAVSKTNPNTVWVGTGEVLMARSAVHGVGVFKSLDAGQTWEHMGLADTNHIGRVVIDPRDENTVYVAAIGHRHSANKERGVFKTTDGGKTWQESLVLGDNISAIDFVIDPSNSKVLYSTTWQRDTVGQNHGGPGSGIYKSVDAGKSWKRLENGLPSAQSGRSSRIAIALAASNPKVIYALVDDAVYNVIATGAKKEKPRDILFRSADAGESWVVVNDSSLRTGWDWCEIRVSPDNENEVYSIGQKSFHSTDGGKTFTEIGGEVTHILEHQSTTLHLDTHAMWIDPSNTDRILFGNDGGLYASYDRAKTWVHINNLPIAECYAVTYDTAVPFNIYTGTQDNAALFGPHNHVAKNNGADAWKHVYLDPWGGGDSYFTFRDPTDKNTVYYEHQYGELRRKNMKTGKTERIKPKSPDKKPLRFAWMTPYFPSHFDGSTLYYAANRVFKSNDRGDSWKIISGDLADGVDTPNLRYKAITTLVESKLKRGLLFAGTDNGYLFRTDDDGDSWKPISEGLPQLEFTRVATSPHHKETVYAALSGKPTDHFSPFVYRSDDSGETWRAISDGLPLETVNVILEDPNVADRLFIGTDLGVYVSENGGTTWQSLCGNLPAVSVHDLFVHPSENKLVIGTHGRSVYVMDLGTWRD